LSSSDFFADPWKSEMPFPMAIGLNAVVAEAKLSYDSTFISRLEDRFLEEDPLSLVLT
jgi:hypothetical protein